MQIHVFITNLSDSKRISDAGASLDVHPHIFEWNVDMHDVDNVLRVVSSNIEAKEIQELVLNAGYYCEELQ